MPHFPWQTLDDVIKLSIIDADKASMDQKEYNYQELKDLQSKLMLVAGRADEGKDQIDRFVDVCMTFWEYALPYMCSGNSFSIYGHCGIYNMHIDMTIVYGLKCCIYIN